MIPTFDILGKEKDLSFEFAGTSGCPHLLGIQSERGLTNIDKYNCKNLNQKIFNHIKSNNYHTVIMYSRWGYYTPCYINCRTNRLSVIGENYNTAESFVFGLNKTITEYEKIGVNVIFMHDNPQQFEDPLKLISKNRLDILSNNLNEKEVMFLINKYSVDIKSHEKDREWINSLLLKTKNGNFSKIKIDDYLCEEFNCKLMIDGKFLYGDDDHLSIFGAKYLYSLMKEDIHSLLSIRN